MALTSYKFETEHKVHQLPESKSKIEMISHLLMTSGRGCTLMLWEIQDIISEAKSEKVSLPSELLDTALKYGQTPVVIKLLAKNVEDGFRIDHAEMILNNLHLQEYQEARIAILQLFHAKINIPAEEILTRWLYANRPIKPTFEYVLSLLNEAGIHFSMPIEVALLTAWKEKRIAPQNAPLLLELGFLSTEPASGDWKENPLSFIAARLQGVSEEELKRIYTDLTKAVLEMKAVPTSEIIELAIQLAPLEIIEFLIDSPRAKLNEELLINIIFKVCIARSSKDTDTVPLLMLVQLKLELTAEEIMIRILQTYQLTKEQFECTLCLLEEADIAFSVPLKDAFIKAWKTGRIAEENLPMLIESGYLAGQWVKRPYGSVKVPEDNGRRPRRPFFTAKKDDKIFTLTDLKTPSPFAR